MQPLTDHGYGQAMTKPGRERRQNEAYIDLGDVIGDEQRRPAESGQPFAATHVRVSKQLGGRPHKQVVNAYARGSLQGMLRPARIAVTACRGCGPVHQLFQLAHRHRAGKMIFIEIDLVTVLQRAHQLDAFQRIEVEFFRQARPGAKTLRRPSGDAGN